MTLPKSTKPLTRERRGIDEHIADADKLHDLILWQDHIMHV